MTLVLKRKLLLHFGVERKHPQMSIPVQIDADCPPPPWAFQTTVRTRLIPEMRDFTEKPINFTSNFQ